MEFLSTLYESEYFIYIVGGAIGVLLILFLVILLSGKKKDKVKEEKVVEQTSPVIEKSVIADTIPVRDNSLDVTKEFKPEDLAVLQTKMAEPVKEVVSVMPLTIEEEPEEVMAPVKPAMPPMDSLITPEPKTTVLDNQFSSVFVANKTVEEVKTVNPETLINNTPEEKVTFKVMEENELPKLSDENKEL